MLYGGVSPEHEVAIVTALQVMNALKEAGFEVLPGYIGKDGSWYLGDDRYLRPEVYKDLTMVKQVGKRSVVSPDRQVALMEKGFSGFKKSKRKIDVVFPVFHGHNGEDGCMAALMELTNMAYVGCGVSVGGVGIDKFMTKKVAEGVDLKVLDDVLVTKELWKENKKGLIKKIKGFGLPVFVKPNSLGSSIGMTKVSNWSELENAVEVAFTYDQRVLVEKGIEKPTEVNISILGNGPYRVSVTEEPVSEGEGLSFDDKYLGGGGKSEKSKGTKAAGMAGAKRIMPARVSEKLIKEIEKKTVELFTAMGGKGISRMDYMVDKKDNLFFNEINTMPGSLSFYLWEKSGLEFADLVKELVEMAQSDWRRRQGLVTTFESNILAGFVSGGTKGGKGKV